MNLNWRIVFFGTPSFSIPSLEGLLLGLDEVVAVVTQPDRGRGRGHKVSPCPVKEMALKHGIRLFQPETVKEEHFQEELKALQPDLIIVIAYGQILPKSILTTPRRGAVNVHASLLPKYRGAAPIAWALLNGEKTTGVTTMMMDEGMDTGDILLQREVFIGETETQETLQRRLSLLGSHLLMDTIEKMKTETLDPVPQDHSKATYAPPLKKEDGRIDWSKKAIEIHRQVRAFCPWPGAFTEWGGRRLKIYGGEAREGKAVASAGTVAWVGSDFIEVGTGEGSFVIKEMQPEGKKRMSVREFLSGHSIQTGAILQ